MNLSIFSLLLLLVICSAVATTTVLVSGAVFVARRGSLGYNPPSIPTYSLPNHMKYNARIPEEGAQSTVSETANSDGSKFIKTTYTIAGTYTNLIRNDLLGYYDFYEIDGVQVCYALKLKQPLPITPLNFNNFYFNGITLMNGKEVNVWRILNQVYAVTIWTDAETGALLGGDNKDTMTTDYTVFEFINGTNYNPPPADSVFDVPAACNNAPPPVYADEEVEEQIRQRFMFHRLSSYAERAAGKNTQSKKYHTGTVHSLSANAQRLKKHQPHMPSLARQLSHPNHLLPENHFDDILRTNKREGASSYQLKIDNSNYLSPVRDQGVECGGCWAFSSVAVAELYINRAYGNNAKNNGFNRINRANSLSVQSVLDCAHGDLNGTALLESKGCMGGCPRTAMLHIAEHGIVDDFSYPFDAANGRQCNLNLFNKTDRFYPFKTAFVLTRKGDNDTSMVPQMEAALQKYGAFVAIINTFYDWLAMSQGIYDNPQCTPSLNHAVAVIGMGVDETTGAEFWKVKNSFGRGWGLENGFFRMAKGKNMCGIEDFAFIAVPSQF